MTHLEEGSVVALRDMAPVGGSAEDHVATCSQCLAMIEEARARAVAIESLLAELDELDEPVDLERSKASVRARLDSGPWKPRSRAGTIWSSAIGRAAAVLLLAAGAAYALPGSPVREWISGAPGQPDAASSAALDALPTDGSGVAVPVGENGIDVVINGADPGSELEVLWVTERTARISAPRGSAFRYGDDRLEAQLAEGPVHVQLPATGSATMYVNGLVYLRRSGTDLQVEGPVNTQSAVRILFTVHDR